MRPAIVSTTQFKIGHSKQSKAYIDYLDREEAKRNHAYNKFNFIQEIKQDDYIMYMKNPDKTHGLFTQEKDYLSATDVKTIKEKFQKAQENGSPLWQTVFSFDNQFLIEQGLYIEKNQVLNEHAIREAVRKSMIELFRKEAFSDSVVWTGAIHFNTDNIHVHVGFMEENPSRQTMIFNDKVVYRGKLKAKSLDKMKSTFINSFLNRSQALNDIQLLIRNNLTKNVIDQQFINQTPHVITLLNQLQKKLPTDKRLWRYNMNAMKEFRADIDYISYHLMTKYANEELNVLYRKLDEQQKFYERLYGSGTKNFERYKDYKDNKIKELYARSGNSILKFLKDNHGSETFQLSSKSRMSISDIKKLKHIFKNEIQQCLTKWQYEHDEAQREWQRKINQEQGRY